jgi:HTH-type transcriptional regulator, quorum sensing regulator NprR
METCLEEDMEQARKAVQHIREHYTYIPCCEQEAYYYLLETLFHLKIKETDRAQRLYETEYLPMINENYLEELPAYLQELHHRVSALKHYQAKDYVGAYKSYLKQIPLLEEELKVGKINYNIAMSLMLMYDFRNAIKYAKQALTTFTNEEEWMSAAYTYNLLGILHGEIRSFVESESYLLEALDLVEYHELPGIKDRIYHNFGLLYRDKDENDKALEFLKIALAIKKEENKADIIKTYRYIISIYLDEDEIDEAQKTLNEAKSYSKDQNELHFLKAMEAKIMLHVGKHGDYEEKMLEAFNYFYESKNYKYIIEYADELGDYYQRARKYKKASEFYKYTIDAYQHLEGKGSL